MYLWSFLTILWSIKVELTFTCGHFFAKTSHCSSKFCWRYFSISFSVENLNRIIIGWISEIANIPLVLHRNHYSFRVLYIVKVPIELAKYLQMPKLLFAYLPKLVYFPGPHRPKAEQHHLPMDSFQSIAQNSRFGDKQEYPHPFCQKDWRLFGILKYFFLYCCRYIWTILIWFILPQYRLQWLDI